MISTRKLFVCCCDNCGDSDFLCQTESSYGIVIRNITDFKNALEIDGWTFNKNNDLCPICSRGGKDLWK